MTARKVVGTIHLWLGMISGLVVFIIAITGCLYVFREEIEYFTEPWRYADLTDGPVLPPSALIKIGEGELPGKQVHAVMYGRENDASRVIFYNRDEDYYYQVFVHPTTGRVQHVRDENCGFFHFILDGHFYLWLPPEIGQPTVAVSTLLFVVMIVTGLFMWWPRNKNGVKQRFSVKWSARWRRRNYDLHNVLGFYAFTFAMIFSLTGLVWGFEWFRTAYYSTLTGGREWQDYEEPRSELSNRENTVSSPVDQVWRLMVQEYPESHWIEVHTPEDSVSCIAANANPDDGMYWRADYRYFDAYSLEEYEVTHLWGRLKQTTSGEKLMRMNYDIHVGSILGLPGKVLAFLASLVIASLPVTGFLIWRGRRRGKSTGKSKVDDDSQNNGWNQSRKQ